MQLDKILEALIFAAENPLKPEQMLDIFQQEDPIGIGIAEMEIDAAKIEGALQKIQERYQSEEHVFELKQIDGGYQFYTKRAYYPFVKHAALAKSQKKLSRASLETLSIIAYRQPITKTEIEFIRGVNCDYAVRKLLDKGLVDIRGRADAPGRPMLFGTSSHFMEYFGINDITDLPKLTELEVDESEFKAQFKIYLNDEETEVAPEVVEKPVSPTSDHNEEE